MRNLNWSCLLIAIATLSCGRDDSNSSKKEVTIAAESIPSKQDNQHLPGVPNNDSISYKVPEEKKPLNAANQINTKNVSPEKLMRFAETLIGVPYKYASTDPKAGFDCSGFITYVFNHFDIKVPRSSFDFTNVGEPLEEGQVKRGDIILFTGTDPTETNVGHMGLVVSNADSLRFIHSTSGKAYSVTITPLNTYYRNRLVGFRRIFKSK